MESVNKRVIVISIILAFFTTGLVFMYIKNATVKPADLAEIVIYKAAKTMPAKYEITESDIEEDMVTKEHLNPDAALVKADIIGKRLKDSIIAGEQILNSRLVQEDNLTLAYNIPEGMRAISVNVNEQINVSNLISPGDYVDIIASFPTESTGDGTDKANTPAVTTTLIQNIQVLSLGQNLNIEEGKEMELPKTVTLSVTPKDAERLTYVTEFATIRMTLRRTGDEKIISGVGVEKDDLIGGIGTLVGPNQ